LILDASISRHHAHLVREGDRWRLRDLGSSNGTFLNDHQVTEVTAVAHGDRIAIGAVGFYLVCGLGEIPVVEVDSTIITTIRSLKRADLRPGTGTERSDGVPTFVEREQTDEGLPVVAMKISEPSGGGGGILEIGDLSVQLSTNQAELIGLLARRMLDEAHQPAQVRGFVRSSELLASLSWDSHEPDENHIKQLIRRARRLVMKAGLGDLIESRQRFGYRLRMIPASAP
jgi:pSer/pThr/pTyr-binding forkhead associated (FHA) protein